MIDTYIILYLYIHIYIYIYIHIYIHIYISILLLLLLLTIISIIFTDPVRGLAKYEFLLQAILMQMRFRSETVICFVVMDFTQVRFISAWETVNIPSPCRLCWAPVATSGPALVEVRGGPRLVGHSTMNFAAGLQCGAIREGEHDRNGVFCGKRCHQHLADPIVQK
jgi:hypothetical protein